MGLVISKSSPCGETSVQSMARAAAAAADARGEVSAHRRGGEEDNGGVGGIDDRADGCGIGHRAIHGERGVVDGIDFARPMRAQRRRQRGDALPDEAGFALPAGRLGEFGGQGQQLVRRRIDSSRVVP